ncbi:hypothetical protein [Massilia sp. Root418]|uniref:hypothetical protein n=1 Tax=Massilia sp. Root418 TaxID=1736532 RepID=UPI000AEE1083|nr:hypothetical protein [Massilia sp. Root418]
MDRQQHLLQMAQKMSAATAASDWTALSAINTLMAAALPTLAAQGPWSPAERAALAALRQLHRQAEHCAKLASDDLAAKLSELQSRKEGWMAYAMTSADNDTGAQAVSAGPVAAPDPIRNRSEAADTGTTA